MHQVANSHTKMNWTAKNGRNADEMSTTNLQNCNYSHVIAEHRSSNHTIMLPLYIHIVCAFYFRTVQKFKTERKVSPICHIYKYKWILLVWKKKNASGAHAYSQTVLAIRCTHTAKIFECVEKVTDHHIRHVCLQQSKQITLTRKCCFNSSRQFGQTDITHRTIAVITAIKYLQNGQFVTTICYYSRQKMQWTVGGIRPFHFSNR